ncbi:DUF4006 family protein [Campylobacter sp. FMV-PI01]|uniref:DUF4006 family protein n=1 Tax=Campylobacter portucalensis TaxID=2608384 RepID=A0A6L5WIQ7_9BACT|nr:DUF4006 family protein [Campylobacter portucalensis]MSN96137.1 DUF4006 family protein [Campylobacter portucalensis]
MDNKSRNIFGIHGISGMLIATVLLISILVVLTIFGIKVQQSVADKPYTLNEPNGVTMKSDMQTANKVMQVK